MNARLARTDRGYVKACLQPEVAGILKIGEQQFQQRIQFLSFTENLGNFIIQESRAGVMAQLLGPVA